MSNKQDIIVGLDIGTTKICAIAGCRNEYGKIEVLGVGKADSLGVSRGVVSNIEKTVQAISMAIAECENKAGIEVGSVYVGIAGQHIKSLQHRGIHTRSNHESEICKGDIRKLIEDMHRLVLPPGDKIIHVLPQEFIIDGEQGIKDPIGMAGIRLEANFHIITGQISAAQNIHKCVKKGGIEVEEMVLEPLASAASVLSEEEKEAGVALVDIGGGTTDIAIFQEGIIRHTAVIPLGGNIVTKDIKEGCLVMGKHAEQLKVKFGSALSQLSQENEIISIPGLKGREPKEISVKNLAHIIQARMEEILEHVLFEIKSSGFGKKLIGGVVMTGGGSQLKNLVQLVEYITGYDARVGYPTEHLAKGYAKEITNPMFATGIGLILRGYEELDDEIEINRGRQDMDLEMETANMEDDTIAKVKKKGIFIKSLQSIKNWFEEDDYKDFS